MIPVIYVSGPLRAEKYTDVQRNTRRAEEVGLMVAKLGGSPIIPHANLLFLTGSIPEETLLEFDIAVIKKCDAVVFLPGWAISEGCREEKLVADEFAIKQFFLSNDLQELSAFIREFNEKDML